MWLLQWDGTQSFEDVLPVDSGSSQGRPTASTGGDNLTPTCRRQRGSGPPFPAPARPRLTAAQPGITIYTEGLAALCHGVCFCGRPL